MMCRLVVISDAGQPEVIQGEYDEMYNICSVFKKFIRDDVSIWIEEITYG